MSLPGIFRRLFANDGYGPLLRREIIPYEICEFYYFRHPVLRPGFQPAQGGLIENAAELYPEAWEYLQTEEGRLLCKTEAEWQAMTTATWATLADGTKVGWDGIGGAPFYVQDLADDFTALAAQLASVKGKFILSLNDTPGVREVFKTFRFEAVRTRYTCSNGKNVPAGELFICNY